VQLIRQTERKLIHGRVRPFGIFICPDCGKEVELCIKIGRRLLCCGCNSRQRIIETKRKNGIGITHGDSRTGNRLYMLWNGIKSRCYRAKKHDYPIYQGKGIVVCNEWKNSYKTFKEWALSNGYKQGLQIDRINSNGNYEPNNCRFVTVTENIRNRPFNKLDINKARLIRGLYFASRHKQQSLAKLFNTNQVTVWSVINNKTWKENSEVII
jgi:hypothetical protein